MDILEGFSALHGLSNQNIDMYVASQIHQNLLLNSN
jgi:hypothetical protein